MVRPSIFGAGLIAASILGAGVAIADESASSAVGTGEFSYGFDEASLRRDIAGVAYLGASQPEEPVESDSENGLIFLGGGLSGGFLGFWYPTTGQSDSLDTSFPNSAANWTDRIQIGMDWRPDLGVSNSTSPRATMRYLAGSEPDRVGVRADLTAVLFDGPDPSQATAWRVTGMLGSTSVSLAPDTIAAVGGGSGNEGGLMWDIGVGWSSGPISLNAGYLSAYTQVDGLASDMATLSFGADYTVLPGLSLYGELNVVDDPVAFGEERLGTVFIVGTGLNF